jgi:hypothetical protein
MKKKNKLGKIKRRLRNKTRFVHPNEIEIDIGGICMSASDRLTMHIRIPSSILKRVR